MPIFRLLTLGPNRKIEAATDIECADEEEAIAQATQLLDGHDMELWQYGYFIQFKSKD